MATHAADPGRGAEPSEVLLPDNLKDLLAAPALPPASADGVKAAQRRALDGPGLELIPADLQGARAARRRLPVAAFGPKRARGASVLSGARALRAVLSAEVPFSSGALGPAPRSSLQNFGPVKRSTVGTDQGR